MTEPKKLLQKSRAEIPSSWNLDRLRSLLKTNLEEIAKEKPLFFGTLKIDINFREGEFETVAVGRRQTFKN